MQLILLCFIFGIAAAAVTESHDGLVRKARQYFGFGGGFSGYHNPNYDGVVVGDGQGYGGSSFFDRYAAVDDIGGDQDNYGEDHSNQCKTQATVDKDCVKCSNSLGHLMGRLAELMIQKQALERALATRVAAKNQLDDVKKIYKDNLEDAKAVQDKADHVAYDFEELNKKEKDALRKTQREFMNAKKKVDAAAVAAGRTAKYILGVQQYVFGVQVQPFRG